jgi:hypothetical protein
MSRITTFKPARAATCAIPLPIVPAPITAIVLIKVLSLFMNWVDYIRPLTWSQSFHPRLTP